MTSEIRANTLKNRVGLGTVSFTNTGPVVSGIVTANTLRLPDATSGSLGRLQLGNGLYFSMYHDGTNSHIVNNNGYLTIQSQAGVNGIFIARNAEVNLYYGPSVRLQTSSVGVTINRDLDVDGHTNLDNVSIAGVTTTGGITANGSITATRLTISSATPRLYLTDTNNNDDFQVRNANGTFEVRNDTDSYTPFSIASNNTVTVYNDLDINGDLDVDGHTNLDNVSIAGVTTFTGRIDVSDNIAITSGNRLYFGNSDTAFIKGEHGASAYLSFGANNEKMRLTRAGRLGIGTDNPLTELHVHGETFTDITIHSERTSGNIGGINFRKGGVTSGIMTAQYLVDVSGNHYFYSQGSERLKITSGGNVQLNTDGQQLTFGSSQKMKFYYESSEERMYLQGDGAYGFAFRVNSGNRIEISKTTGDVVMQGASGRNFQWDNSEASLYLTDSGSGSSARLKIGTGGDLQMYHDVSANVNHITAATNGEIKSSANQFSFYDYTGVTKRAVIDSNGLRIGTVASPTLPTTGKPPMIMRTETYFTKEVHRTISDYRSICDGTHSGYLLLVPAWPGSNTAAKKFYGTVIYDRGSTGSGNSTNVSTVHASVAYNEDQFYVENARNSQYATLPAKVTYNGTAYLALKFGSGGGGPHNGIHIDGIHYGTDSNFLRLVRSNEVDSVQNDSHGAIANNNATMPICGVMVVSMDGTDLNNNSIRYMRGGTIHFEYSPAQTDCYDNGIFTARVNGIYHVTAGVLTGNNVGRVEFAIQRQVSGGSYQTVINFNGAGDFANSHNGPTATAFIKMKAGWNLRVYRSSSNQGAYASTHANNFFGAVLMHGLMDSQV